MGYEGLFQGCSSLQFVNIPVGIETIAQRMFMNCTKLSNITLPNNIKKIASSAFSGCQSLQTIKLPDSLEEIGTGAFAYTSLVSLNIPKSVKSIGGSTFSGCEQLSSITFNEGLESIGGHAFSGSSIKSLSIPKSVSFIGEYAFYCSKLESITLPTNIDTIEEGTFMNCELKSITLPRNIKSIGYRAFRDCEQLSHITIQNGLNKIGSEAFDNCKNLSSIELPASLVELGHFTFRNCINLRTATIPNSVTIVGGGVFLNCEKLSTVNLSNQMTVLPYAHDFYEESGGFFQGCKSLKSIVVPYNISEIGTSAFEDCDSLATVNLTENLKIIKSAAFKYCKRLQSINIPNTVEEIGASAFSFTGIKQIQLPTSLKSIEPCLFYRCYNLESVHLPEDITTICQDAFMDCDRLNNIVLSNKITSIGDEAFKNCQKLCSIVFPDSLRTIGNRAFYSCRDLSSIVFPTNLEIIGEDAFYYTKWFNKQEDGPLYINKVLYKYIGSLEQNSFFRVKDGTISISNYAFLAQHGLTKVALPNSLKEIGNEAFSCTNITDINIPNSVVSIGAGAFAGCKDLASVKLSNNLTFLNYGVFNDCIALQTLKIPASVTTIYNNFENCTNMRALAILCPKPPTNYEVTFFQSLKNCILYVPKSSFEDYKHHCYGQYERLFKEIKVYTDLYSLYEENIDSLAKVNASLKEVKYILESECPDVKDIYILEIQSIENYIDSLITEINNKFELEELSANDKVDIKPVMAKIDTIRQNALSDQYEIRKKAENEEAFKRLKLQLSVLQNNFNSVKSKIEKECFLALDEIYPKMDSIQLQIDSLVHEIQIKYESVLLSSESNLDCQSIETAIQSLLENALEAQKVRIKNEEAYNRLSSQISAVQKDYDYVKSKIEIDFSDVADIFIDKFDHLQFQIDSIKIKVDSLYKNILLDDTSVIDTQILSSRIYALLEQANTAQHAFEQNKVAYARLINELAMVQLELDKIKSIINAECPHVEKDFIPIINKIQQQINSLKDSIETDYNKGSLTSESKIDTSSILEEIEKILKDAYEAEDILSGINHIIIGKQNSFIIFNLEGKQMNKLQKGLNIIKFRNGLVRKIFIR